MSLCSFFSCSDSKLATAKSKLNLTWGALGGVGTGIFGTLLGIGAISSTVGGVGVAVGSVMLIQAICESLGASPEAGDKSRQVLAGAMGAMIEIGGSVITFTGNDDLTVLLGKCIMGIGAEVLAKTAINEVLDCRAPQLSYTSI